MPRNPRTLQIGGTGVLIAMVMMALPLVLPRNPVNRFLVAIGFIAMCWSLSLLLNAALDLVRQRGKR